MQPLIKVLIISQKSNYGGIHTILKSLFKVFNNDNNIELSIYFSDVNDLLDNYNFENDFYRVYESYTGFFRKIFKTRNLFKNFDILHFNIFAPWLLLPLLFTKKTILFTNHGAFGHGRKLRLYEHLKKYLLSIFLKYFVNRIINVSNDTKEDLMKQYNLDSNKNVVIHNITEWKTKEIDNNVTKKSLTLGYHGRFVGFKRVRKIFETAVFLNKDIPTTILLIGTGNLKKEYEMYSTNYKIGLEIEDYTKDVEKILNRIDFYVLASKHEPFGISALESISAGIPTFILEDGGGAIEIFGIDFKWFVCNSPQDIAEKIILFNNNFGDIRNTFINLQKSIKTKFSEKYLHKRLSECYFDILANKEGKE